tara:strand:+ start:288 stop:806 length:519 start_codon:yes stop_codon:yes gene_type:complete
MPTLHGSTVCIAQVVQTMPKLQFDKTIGRTIPMTEATQRPSEDAMEFDEIFQASSTLPWAVIQDQYGNESIVDSMGDFVVEMAEQTIDADLIVKAVNSHDALVVAIEDMEESRENLKGLVQRLTIQNDALVVAVSNFLGWVDAPMYSHSDLWGGVPETPEMEALRAALEQVK